MVRIDFTEKEYSVKSVEQVDNKITNAKVQNKLKEKKIIKLLISPFDMRLSVLNCTSFDFYYYFTLYIDYAMLIEELPFINLFPR